MDIIILAVRVVAGAIICLYGLGKLVRLPLSADRMWRPRWLTGAMMRAGVVCVSVVEVIFGVMTALAPLPAVDMAIFGVLLGGGLSVYGAMALRRGGQCGCGGGSTRTETEVDARARRFLLGRNAAIFGAAIIGTAYGPSLAALSHAFAPLIPSLATIPTIGLGTMLVARMVETRVRRIPRSGHAAVYQRLRHYQG